MQAARYLTRAARAARWIRHARGPWSWWWARPREQSVTAASSCPGGSERATEEVRGTRQRVIGPISFHDAPARRISASSGPLRPRRLRRVRRGLVLTERGTDWPSESDETAPWAAGIANTVCARGTGGQGMSAEHKARIPRRSGPMIPPSKAGARALP
jgi:hypothetical protein